MVRLQVHLFGMVLVQNTAAKLISSENSSPSEIPFLNSRSATVQRRKIHRVNPIQKDVINIEIATQAANTFRLGFRTLIASD
jgi:hypothetical protein